MAEATAAAINAEAITIPVEPQLVADDVTSETAQKILAEQGGRIAVLSPEGGFFAMVDVRAIGRTSNEVRLHLLEQQGVVLAHGSAYGPGGEGTLRVSFASGGDNLTRGLERLRAGLLSL